MFNLECISAKTRVKCKSPSMRYFCPSAIFDYLGGQLGDKLGDNLQISKLKVKNLQKWAQFLMLEIKRFTSYICR